jgi:formylglycine-generating enzyme required for sulfatase activity
MELAQDERVGSPKRLPLLGERGAYVPLLFDVPMSRRVQTQVTPDGKAVAFEDNAQPIESVLNLFPGHLAIVGDAGSGKTTVLHVITSALAAEDPATVAPDLAAALPDPLPLPIYLPLRFFEYACCDENSGYKRCAQDLLRFVDDWFADWCPEADLPPRFLESHLRAGRAWFLLDALDEVADATNRETVRSVIQDLAGHEGDLRLIVTARVAAYRATRLDDRFTVATVRDLNQEQREQMVRVIYTGLELENAGRSAQDLIDRFAGSEALRDLARTPVMVWTAAVIHALRGELPEGRAALYDAYVDILLKKSFERARDDAASLEDLVGGQGFSLQDRRHYLTYAAFQVHGLLEGHPERHPTREGDRRVVVGEDELVDEILAPYFQEKMYLDDRRHARQQAQAFAGLMVERSGLLYETTQGYTVGDHLTMQEFLAARYLGDDYRSEDPESYETFLKEKVGRSWWREVFLLAAGYLAEKGFKAPKFLEEIARQGDSPEEKLAALALAGQGLVQLRAHVQRPTWYAGLAQKLAGRLYSLLYAEPVDAHIATRQEAGLVLGLLYGYPGEDGLTDPRFAGPQGLPAFVPVEAGAFWMGEDDSEEDERPRHRVTLDRYEIARYPTTNAMYARFIADGGYADARWWEEAIADGYWKEGEGHKYGNSPRYWDNPKWNNPSQPVVGVNWYQALAYCRWLTATVDDGHTYRLPTEAEWERAARGTSSQVVEERAARGSLPSPWEGEGPGVRVYPWGDEWREGHCNSEEADLSVTSPVGLFPRGAAEGGVQDMAGNVWEWCQDWYEEDYYAQSQDARNPSGPEKGKYRVLRGGSWYNDKPRCRCACRYGNNPWRRYYNWGFRCVRTSSS